MKYYVYEIEWDTDGQEVEGLPTEVVVELNDYPDDEGEALINYLSDKYGWCINGMDYEDYDAYIGRIARRYVEARESGQSGSGLHAIYEELRHAVKEVA